MVKNTVSSKNAFNQATDPDQEKYAKENKIPDNSSISNDPLSLTIFGTQGGKARYSAEVDGEKIDGEFVPEEDGQKKLSDVDLTVHEGLISGKNTQGVEFIVKQEDDFDKANLDGGKVSRLTLIEEGKATAHFVDGEWYEDGPSTPLQYEAVDQIQETFGELDQEEDQEINSHDRGKDIDRDHDI